MLNENTHKNLMEEQKLKDLVEWFKHAEVIGQQRLYNFLMTASILLLACAAILASSSPQRFPLSIFGGFGFMLSLFWSILGSRQRKFHKLIEKEIDDLLLQNEEKRNFAVFHIRELQRDSSSVMSLWRLEKLFSSRTFLWLVPAAFALMFAVILSALLFKKI